MSKRELLTVDVADVSMLAEALADGGSGVRWYFHLTTGDVREAGDWNDGFDDDELEYQGWMLVASGGSRASFEDMEIFAQAVGEARARDLLTRALEGKGAFRRFRDTLREFAEVRDAWTSWSNAREESRAVKWLFDNDVVDEFDAEAHLADRNGQAQSALDQVRRLGGATYDIDEVPHRWHEIVAQIELTGSATLTREGRTYAAISTYDIPT